MRKVFVVFMMIVIVLSISTVGFAYRQAMIPEEYQLTLYRGRVLGVEEVTLEGFGNSDASFLTQVADVKILNKEYRGEIVEITNTLSGDSLYDIELKRGDVVSVYLYEGHTGESAFYLMGYENSGYMLQMIGIFLLFLVIIGGWKGVRAIVSLSVIIALIIYVMVPMLLAGYNAILIAFGICAVATMLTLIIISGWNKKTQAAIVGTVGGIIVSSIIAYIYGTLTRLTGLSSGDAQMLLYLPQDVQFDFRGLLFAGILIGALGAVMDVSVSIASALNELSESTPELPFKKIFKYGMAIGKDIMGTMTNTLILAYTGTSLPIILVFIGFQKTIDEIVNLHSIVVEIVRALAGSMGLLFAIPITVVSYALLNKRQKSEKVMQLDS